MYFLCPLLFRISRIGLSEKRVANAFWNGELESELRDRGKLDMFGLSHIDSDREVIMAHIDNIRAQSNYSHPPEDCTDDCKVRGDFLFCDLLYFFIIIQ